MKKHPGFECFVQHLKQSFLINVLCTLCIIIKGMNLNLMCLFSGLSGVNTALNFNYVWG